MPDEIQPDDIQTIDHALTAAILTLGKYCTTGPAERRITAATILLQWQASEAATWVFQPKENNHG